MNGMNGRDIFHMKEFFENIILNMNSQRKYFCYLLDIQVFLINYARSTYENN